MRRKPAKRGTLTQNMSIGPTQKTHSLHLLISAICTEKMNPMQYMIHHKTDAGVTKRFNSPFFQLLSELWNSQKFCISFSCILCSFDVALCVAIKIIAVNRDESGKKGRTSKRKHILFLNGNRQWRKLLHHAHFFRVDSLNIRGYVCTSTEMASACDTMLKDNK